MSEEKKYRVKFDWDQTSWDAIQQGKQYTNQLNAPLQTPEEKNIVHGPIISNSQEMQDYADQPHFGNDENKEPEREIVTSPEEYASQKADWEKGQMLKTLHPDQEAILQWIADTLIQQVRNEQDGETGDDRDRIANRALQLRYYREFCSRFFNTIEALKILKEPAMAKLE